jgi:hypothetical protein
VNRCGDIVKETTEDTTLATAFSAPYDSEDGLALSVDVGVEDWGTPSVKVVEEGEGFGPAGFDC